MLMLIDIAHATHKNRHHAYLRAAAAGFEIENGAIYAMAIQYDEQCRK